jgi:hypothetical protein
MIKLVISLIGDDSSTCLIKEGNSVEEILFYICQRYLYPVEDGLTEKEILKRIEDMNGDGCDWIISITNLTEGTVIFNCNESLEG